MICPDCKGEVKPFHYNNCPGPVAPAPLLPGVSASECRELAAGLIKYSDNLDDEGWETGATVSRRAAAILRSVADAIDKGGKP